MEISLWIYVGLLFNNGGWSVWTIWNGWSSSGNGEQKSDHYEEFHFWIQFVTNGDLVFLVCTCGLLTKLDEYDTIRWTAAALYTKNQVGLNRNFSKQIDGMKTKTQKRKRDAALSFERWKWLFMCLICVDCKAFKTLFVFLLLRRETLSVCYSKLEETVYIVPKHFWQMQLINLQRSREKNSAVQFAWQQSKPIYFR